MLRHAAAVAVAVVVDSIGSVWYVRVTECERIAVDDNVVHPHKALPLTRCIWQWLACRRHRTAGHDR